MAQLMAQGVAQKRLFRTPTPYLFLLPAVTLILLFRFYPIVGGLQEAFYTNNLSAAGDRAFVGFDNFTYIAEDLVIGRSLGVTVAFTLVAVPLQTALALFLAELVNRRLPGMGVFRALYLIPVAVSINVTAIIWGLALDENNGLINGILRTLGLARQPFLSSPDQALWCIILIVSWIAVPYWSLFFLSGLQNISSDVVESAQIDGANFWQIFLYVKVPLLKRIMAFVIVANTVGSVTLFAPVYIITRGGPRLSTHLIMYEIYQRGFVYGDLGVAAAMALILLAVIAIIVGIQIAFLRAQH